LQDFIRAVPKAELHIHIEGSLEPEMMMHLAARNGLTPPYAGVEEARAAYDFRDLQSFLDLYYKGCEVLRTEADFFDLCFAYLKRAASDNVKRTEIFFDPQTHLANGVPFETALNGLLKALEVGRSQLDIDGRLICCFLRHLSEESALQALEQALPHKSHFLAVGLDSSEVGNPPSKFERVMAKAREAGLRIVAHAGEEGPASYVWEALNLLQVDRIDHGVRSIEDSALMQHLRDKQVALTVCPLSNLKLRVYEGCLPDKLRELVVGSGLLTTVNSDDPAYFGGYVGRNYEWLAKVLGLGIKEVAELAKNSFKGSFLAAAEVEAWCVTIDKLAAEALAGKGAAAGLSEGLGFRV